ncbi:hypothetical protein H0H81_002660 [Sphagnurus paluster]|uniref:Uncharacterized protein n=1 Tax=Sphagnurus paluster TaxID=117069 RepID=A0A9P7GFL8_9AGAR|nr:hypothetical protein H0H81_002660 [Sphagnurus paluster]
MLEQLVQPIHSTRYSLASAGSFRYVVANLAVHSEQSVVLNPKWRIAESDREREAEDSGIMPKMSTQEASHRLRIGQLLDLSIQDAQPRKDRELRWLSLAQAIQPLIKPGELPNLSNKNVNDLFPIRIGNYAIFRTSKRTYVGQVLDLYKKGSSGRYGSVDQAGSASSLQAISVRVHLTCGMDTLIDGDDDEPSTPIFSSVYGSYHLHTYAPIDSLLYQLGPCVFTPLGTRGTLKVQMTLNPAAELHWISLTRKAVEQSLPKLLIRIRRL